MTHTSIGLVGPFKDGRYGLVDVANPEKPRVVSYYDDLDAACAALHEYETDACPTHLRAPNLGADTNAQ